ncbi:putative Undecaprenyl-diphospho-oligosaccharide flippase [Candidatus Zixiibacteriota bacterium]|nr:putative Undecaprenyl-diphospho-oligosaccharide flippase [candidate division Zixibacteria bacterium]
MPNLLRQFGKNVVTSWISLLVRMGLVFFVNPFIIHSLGNQLYGVWVLVFALINYMTVLDLGLQQALVRYISKFLGLKDYDRVNSILNSSFLIYSIIGAAVIIITFVLSYFSLHWFNIPPEYIDDGKGALFIIGINTALTFIMLPWGGTLGAFHRYDIANIIAVAEDISRTALVVLLLKTGHGIVSLAGAFLLFTIFRLVVSAALLRKLHPPIKFGRSFVRSDTIRMLFNYGLISFFISIAWLLIANTDSVVIGYFLDTSAVTVYAVATAVIIAMRNIIHAVSFPLRPLVSHYDATGGDEKIGRIFLVGTKYLYFLTFAAAAGVLVLAPDFIRLWMGPGYDESAAILKLLIVPAAVYLPNAIGNSVLYAIERHRTILYINLGEGIINLGLTIYLVQKIGIIGVAYGTLISQIVIYLFVMPLLICPILGVKPGRYYYSIIRASASAALLTFGLASAGRLILVPDNWIYFFVIVALSAGGALAAGYYLADRREMSLIREKILS